MKTCFRYAQKTLTAVKITVLEFKSKEDAQWWVKHMLPKDACGFDTWIEHDPIIIPPKEESEHRRSSSH